eukprot:1087913-Prorocentrum_minimum.AAC.1
MPTTPVREVPFFYDPIGTHLGFPSAQPLLWEELTTLLGPPLARMAGRGARLLQVRLHSTVHLCAVAGACSRAVTASVWS